MLSIIILILIIVGLIIHRYLSAYWEQGNLPYAMGFLMFANIFAFIYLVNLIWMFGFILGIIITALTYFQIVFASFLWPFLLPQLVNIYKNQPTSKLFQKLTSANQIIYGFFSYLVIGLGVLMIINFFVSSYASLTKIIIELFDGYIITPILWIVGIAVVSNIIRSCVLSKLLKRDDEKKIRTKNIKKVFQKFSGSKEMKAIIEILDEAGQKFKNNTFEKILKPKIEKIILSNPKKLKQTIEKTMLPKEWVYGAIANISGDLLESGEYHIYRGVLASDFDGSGPGKDLLKIFDEATDELVKIGNIKKEWAEEQKKQLRENIKTVG